MNKTGKSVLIIASFAFAVVPLLSQTSPAQKPSFEVISIKPSAPNPGGIRGGGARGDKYTMSGANLRMLLQNAYQRPSTGGPLGQLQIIGGPNWIDSDRYDIQATADCSGGVLSREQVQLMVQSMLEERFQLKAHMETRELPIYNLVVAKDGPKLKVSEDQTPPTFGAAGPLLPCSPAPAVPVAPPPPPPFPGQRGGGLDPNFVPPRGAMFMMMGPTGLTMQATGVPLSNFINMLQNQVGRPIMDKTDLKGLFDFKMQFSPEGLTVPTPLGGIAPPPGAGTAAAGPAGAPPPAAADPVPSLFTAIQELGLRLESAKGPVAVLVVDSVQKPTEN
jgi:uncharacterized protein (TIGR03435 family)